MEEINLTLLVQIGLLFFLILCFGLPSLFTLRSTTVNVITSHPATLTPSNSSPAKPFAKAPSKTPANASVKPPSAIASNKPLAKMSPTEASARPSAWLLLGMSPRAQWTGPVTAIISLVALLLLFWMRERRKKGSKLDMFGVVLLAQMGILVIFAAFSAHPALVSWQVTVVFRPMVLVSLLGICLVGTYGNRLNEARLELLVQIGLLVLFFAELGLPLLWFQLVADVVILVSLVLLLRIWMAYKNGGKLNKVHLALLVLMGLIAFVVGNQWLPDRWPRICEGAVFLSAIAAVLWVHRKNTVWSRSDEIMMRLVAVGIVLVVVLGYVFPITFIVQST